MASMRMKRPQAASRPVVPGRPPAFFVPSPKSIRGFTYTWIDQTTVPPVNEPPRLVVNSLAQPFLRWGHRRIVRTHMHASMPFQGRWAFAGKMLGRFVERPKLAGVQSRPWTYGYTPASSAPGASRTAILRGPQVGR